MKLTNKDYETILIALTERLDNLQYEDFSHAELKQGEDLICSLIAKIEKGIYHG